MRGLSRISVRLFNFMTRRSHDARFNEEIETHLAIQSEEHIRAGVSPEEAQRLARLSFGSVEAIRETYHAEEGLPLLESILQDVRYTLCVLRKSPAFTVVAFLTLSLGVATNLVVFGVFRAVLRPLAVSDPQSLYQLRHEAWMNARLITTSYPAFEDFRRRNSTFTDMAAVYGYSDADLTWGNNQIAASGDEVSGNYFDLLGVRQEAGRFFHQADEHSPHSAPYVVLSDPFWRNAFHADRSIIGTTIELNKQAFTLIGVAPPQFHGAERFVWPDYWIPLMSTDSGGSASDLLQDRSHAAVTVIGRLRPDVTPQRATENLNAIAVELGKEYPQSDDGQPLRLVHAGLQGDDGEVIRGFLYGVSLLALLVLAAVCANLATLFAARAVDRSHELALRVALGSSRRRLLRQLLTEAIVISLISGAAGMGGAQLLLGMLNRWSPLKEIHLAASLDTRVLLTGLALTLLSALLFGLAPVRHAWSSHPLQMIKRGALRREMSRAFTSRDFLLCVQVAICTLLVVASLVAVRGMIRTLQTPLGFQPRGAMLVDRDLGRVIQERSVLLETRQTLIAAASSIPGVTAAGIISRTPMTGGMHGIPIFRPRIVDFRLQNSELASYVFVMSPGYLEAAGTRLLRGRDVSWYDTTTSPRVAVVNQTFARKMWGSHAAIGQHFIVSGSLTEVVGIVEDGKYHDLEEPSQPVAYLPMSQSENAAAILIVRSRLAASEMAPALERRLSSVAPNVPISVQSWTDTLAGMLLPAQAATAALGVMGALAVMLAITGIFGMAAYNVSRRMKELGIRIALGARKMQVIRAAVGRSIVVLGAGSLIGLLAGTFTRRLLRQIVYQADPRDPSVVGAAVLTMALLGIAAAAIPAWRALTINPAKIMRED